MIYISKLQMHTYALFIQHSVMGGSNNLEQNGPARCPWGQLWQPENKMQDPDVSRDRRNSWLATSPIMCLLSYYQNPGSAGVKSSQDISRDRT